MLNKSEETSTDATNAINYTYDFMCTYQMLDADEADMAENLYRSQFIQAFGLHAYDDALIAQTMHMLYGAYGKNTELEGVIMRNRRNCFMGDNNPYEAFVMLFAYPTFHLLHACIGSLMRGTTHMDTELWEKLHGAI